MTEQDPFFARLARQQAAMEYDYPIWPLAQTEGPVVLRVPRNTHGRDFFVGDLHGMFALLDYRLKDVGFDSAKDRLFSVGDLIDRGPDSISALHWLRQPWFQAVLGNHDQMALDARASFDAHHIWTHYNGGEWAPLADKDLLDQLCVKFAATPYALEIEHERGLIGVVHADVPPGIGWQDFMRRLEAEHAGMARRTGLRAVTWGRERIRGFERAEVPGVKESTS